jgi:nucleotide-binding universal stress UspA family protein
MASSQDRSAKVVVGADGSDHSRAALEWAAAEAVRRGEITTAVRWVERLDPDMLVKNRTAHDLAMLCAGAWMTPEVGARWIASRRRHFDPEVDLMPLQYEGHQLYLQGRPREALKVIELARPRLDPYFDVDPGWPGARESMRLMADVGALFCRAMLGELDPADPQLERAASEAAAIGPGVTDVWVVSHGAWFAWVAGDEERAAELVARIDPYLEAMEPAAAHLGAQMLVLLRAVIASEQASAIAAATPANPLPSSSMLRGSGTATAFTGENSARNVRSYVPPQSDWRVPPEAVTSSPDV